MTFGADGRLIAALRRKLAHPFAFDLGGHMRKLAIFAVALALFASAPRSASAQDSGSTGGAIAATVAGAVVGGAIGYFYFTGQVATLIGVVAGGAIGDWWYNAGTSRDMAMPGGKTKMQYTEPSQPPIQLISARREAMAALRTAPFSAAAN